LRCLARRQRDEKADHATGSGRNRPLDPGILASRIHVIRLQAEDVTDYEVRRFVYAAQILD
jgi:hypothetical protein